MNITWFEEKTDAFTKKNRGNRKSWGIFARFNHQVLQLFGPRHGDCNDEGCRTND